MKVCIETHVAPGFGEIPAGSLWADDSPHAQDADKFAEADTPPPVVKPKRATRKFVEKAASAPVEEV